MPRRAARAIWNGIGWFDRYTPDAISWRAVHRIRKMP